MPAISVYAWATLFGRVKVPREIAERLSREPGTVVQRREVREQLTRHVFDPDPSTPEALGAHVRSQLEIWARTAKEAGIQHE